MTFEIIKGDLFDPAHNFDALAQGVNCQGLMGAGIAVPFRNNYPEMYTEYAALCKKYKAVIPGLLHTYEHKYEVTKTEVTDEYATLNITRKPTIFNLFSQIQPGNNGSYELLQRATLLMLFEAQSLGIRRVGLPWIGCGIAGLARHNVQFIFEDLLSDSDVEFVLVEQ